MLNKVSKLTSNTIYHSVIAAKPKEKKQRIKLPSPTNPPLHLTKAGEVMWKKFWKKYNLEIRKILKGKTTPEKKWAGVVAFFNNFSLKRNVYPFDPTYSMQKADTKEYLLTRFNKARITLKKKARIVLKLLKKNVISRIYKEKIYDVYYNKYTSKFFIASVISASLQDDVELFGSEARKVLLQRGFTRKSLVTNSKEKEEGYIFQTGTGSSYIMIKENEEYEDKIDILLVIQFTPQQVQIITNTIKQNFNKKSGLKKITSELAKLFKKTLIKSKQLDSSLKAFVVDNSHSLIGFISPQMRTLKDIDFNKALKDNEAEILSNLLKEANSLPTQKILEQYNFNYITSLGTPLYQFNLISGLNAILIDRKEKSPDLWSSILTNPNYYLNPNYQDLIESISDNSI